MARRVSVEVRMIDYFKSAPLETAKAVLAICQAEIKSREPKTVKRAKIPIDSDGLPLMGDLPL